MLPRTECEFSVRGVEVVFGVSARIVVESNCFSVCTNLQIRIYSGRLVLVFVQTSGF